VVTLTVNLPDILTVERPRLAVKPIFPTLRNVVGDMVASLRAFAIVTMLFRFACVVLTASRRFTRGATFTATFRPSAAVAVM
jgi:hypothetical protein